MELIYNELSNNPLAADEHVASEAIIRFIKAYKEASKYGFKRIRFSRYLHEIKLADKFTLQDWIKTSQQKTLKDVLLGIIVHPFIDENDEWAEADYINNSYYYEDLPNNLKRTNCEGLAAAHIYRTISISFSISDYWVTSPVYIYKIQQEQEEPKKEEVINIATVGCFGKDDIKTFLESKGNIELIETQLSVDEKKNHIRDDHGKDTLSDFSDRLLLCPYVDGIVNSLAWDRFGTNFIDKIRPDGIVYVRLIWTDKGLGLAVKTTGRNMRETEAIAKFLEEHFSK